MLKTFPRSTSSNLYRGLQFGALAFSILSILITLRLYLENSSQVYGASFERENYQELSRGDALSLARKLGALERQDYISCIMATKSGIPFFESGNRNCKSGFFVIEKAVLEKNEKIEILFLFKLPPLLLWGFFTFLVGQLVLVFSFFGFEQKLLFNLHEKEFQLAELSRQVCHDLMSPLLVLKSFAQTSSDLANFDFKLLKLAVSRLDGLIGFLRGADAEEICRTAVDSLVESAAEEKRREISALGRSPHIAVKVGPEIQGARFLGSELEWRRLISNLLNNAAESYVDTSVSIEVSISRLDSGWIQLRISDRGKGMSELSLARLGLRGFSNGKSAGSGLGFYASKKFIEGIRGRISVVSKLDEGTDVRIEAPAYYIDEIILIEDDQEVFRMWQMSGKRLGAQILHFSSPEEFLEKKTELAKDRPIFLDLNFKNSRIDVLQFGAQIYKEGFKKIILCSGTARGGLRKPAWAAAISNKNPPW